MPFGPLALQWRAPSPNPPPPTSLPSGISRTYVQTPSGPLELLSAIPPSATSTSKPPLFFAHGGFGCASVWLPYMTYFSSKGFPCYAISYRGHGKSWYPGFWAMYFTSRQLIGEDLVAGIEAVEKMEQERRKAEEKVRVVLVSHSAGGALSQYVLSRGMARVQGFCMLAAVPGFGSWSCYTHWLLTAPLHFYYRCFHSRYLLATTSQVHSAFFTASTPVAVVQDLERLLSPYESMAWPMQALSPFVTGWDVLSRIEGWKPFASKSSSASLSSATPSVTPRLLILTAQHDVLCTPTVLADAAGRYRCAFRAAVAEGKVDGVSKLDLPSETEKDAQVLKKEQGSVDGVAFDVVPGLAHHLQNHVEWERGAERLLAWVEKL